jgi:hypothetical protein
MRLGGGLAMGKILLAQGAIDERKICSQRQGDLGSISSGATMKRDRQRAAENGDWRAREFGSGRKLGFRGA